MKYKISAGNKHFDVEAIENKGGILISINGEQIQYEIREIGEGDFFLLSKNAERRINVVETEEGILVYNDGKYFPLEIKSIEEFLIEKLKSTDDKGELNITVSMSGRVVKLLAKKGEMVMENQPLIIIEAMKMENEVRSPRKGLVKEVNVKEGEAVEANQTLLVIGEG